MNLKDAYHYGKLVGYDIGIENKDAYNNFDEYMSDCQEYEQDGFRQYSPFEFKAKEFNESRVPDRTWEEYERGVAVGLRKAWQA